MDQTLSRYDEHTLAPSPQVDPRGAIHVALWVAQVVAAVIFFLAGAYKVSQPITALAEGLPWVNDMPSWIVRFIGFSELVGAIGLIVPAAMRVAPILTSAAGAGLTMVMVFATGFHASRGEWRSVPVTLLLGALVGFVAWGRAMEAPIPSESD
jgi:putative oxidoreductase